MRRALLVAALAAAALPGGNAVAAHPEIAGTTCGYLVATDQLHLVAAPDVYTGYFVAAAAGVDVIHPTGNPVTVEVTCSVLVNGVEKDRATSSGSTGVTTAAGLTVDDSQIFVTDSDVVTVCTRVVATDTAGATTTWPAAGASCEGAVTASLPPDEVCAALADAADPDLCDLQLEPDQPLLPVKTIWVLPRAFSTLA